MRSVLLIAPDFPPMNRQSSRRAAAMAKYLPACGWHVTVLTSLPADCLGPMSDEEVRANVGIPESQIIRKHLPAERAASMGRLARRWLGVIDILCLPGSRSSRWARQVLAELGRQPCAPEVIWATGPHWGPFVAATIAAREHGVPWVADHRDPVDLIVQNQALRRLVAWRERRICRTASHQIAVSEPWAALLRQRAAVPVTVIPNGFDPDWLCAEPPRPRVGTFTIAYTGSAWGSRDVLPVTRAMNELITEGAVPAEEVEILLYSLSAEFLREHGLNSFRKPPRILPKLSLTEILRAQREATVLLVLGMPDTPGVLTSKVFEYMAAGRPVLSYPKHPECLDRVLEATGIGVSCDSVEELKTVLLRWYREWKQTGDIRMSRNPDEIMKYSRKEQAKTLAAVLDRVVAEHKGRGA
ncbi:MAG TPA: glycosyltransferase [Planctomycetota bacterium]|nr:glycosyltransferase [Planctomycetota bacterium]HRR80681.1 glycosyltransferase [Planctomycetota bacterium]HRT93269.1 glycosyltransferase [Planctomycetota bacterium]